MAKQTIKQKIVIDLEVRADGVSKRDIEKAINQSVRELREWYGDAIDDNLWEAEMGSDSTSDFSFTVKKIKR